MIQSINFFVLVFGLLIIDSIQSVHTASGIVKATDDEDNDQNLRLYYHDDFSFSSLATHNNHTNLRSQHHYDIQQQKRRRKENHEPKQQQYTDQQHHHRHLSSQHFVDEQNQQQQQQNRQQQQQQQQHRLLVQRAPLTERQKQLLAINTPQKTRTSLDQLSDYDNKFPTTPQQQKGSKELLRSGDTQQRQEQLSETTTKKQKFSLFNKKKKKIMPDVANNHPYRKTGPIIQPIVGMKFYTNHSYYHDIIPQGTRLLTQPEIRKLHHTYPNLTAIIHIGPMKTGSSAIQASFKMMIGNKVPKNETDNYVDITEYIQPHYSGYGVWNMIGCFRDPRANTDQFIICKPEMLPHVHRIASIEHANVIVSAEFLTSPDTNIPAIKEFLLPWKYHKVVAYYRRYYDWLYSFHNQAAKQVTTPYRQKLTDFLEKESKIQFWWDKMYIINSLNRWKEYFSNIQVFNIYEFEDGDVRDSFYCEALINANTACSIFRTKKQLALATPSSKGKNPSVAFIYEDLAYYAKEMNLWSETTVGGKLLSVDDVSYKIKYYQEKVLNLTKYDFGIAKECPTNDVSEYLLQQTLSTEKYLFPQYYRNVGEQQIRTELATLITTKLCHINPMTILQQNNINGTIWNNFFTKILPAL